MNKDKGKAIRAVISAAVECYATGFSDRHLSEIDDEDGVINMKNKQRVYCRIGYRHSILFSLVAFS